MLITIDKYNSEEQKSRKSLPNRAIESFAPVTFLQFNYPVTVFEETELIRYADAMHEFKINKYYTPEFKCSADEANLIKMVCEKTGELTHTRFGRKVKPWVSPLAALKMFRAITALSGFANRSGLANGNLSVFEIGPGSGFLGAFLISSGYRYGSMDNTQAFYLWQNRLYDYLAGDEFNELALEDRDAGLRRVMHIPWWLYCKLPSEKKFQFDVICCEAALGEMNKIALRYLLGISRQMLSSSAAPLFVFDSIGKKHISDLNGIHNEFIAAGFDLINKDGFFAYTLNGSSLGKFRIHSGILREEGFKKIISRLGIKSERKAGLYRMIEEEFLYYNPSKSPERYGPCYFMDLNKKTMPMDYEFISSFRRDISIIRDRIC